MEAFHSKSEDANVLDVSVNINGMNLQNTTPLPIIDIVAGAVVSDANPLPATLVTSLSDEYDTIDVSKMSKGGVVVAHSAITATATSSEIDCRGFNSISVECAVSAITSGNWVVEILGDAISGGTFGRVFDSGFGEMKTDALSTNEQVTYTFVGIPNYVKIKATRTTNGTLTCKVTPMNL